MARTAVTVGQTEAAGILDTEAVLVALNNPDGAMFINDGKTRLVVKNAGAGAHIVGIVATKTVGPYGLLLPPKTYTIAAGKRAVIGPWETDIYNQKSGDDVNKVYVDSDGTESEVSIKPFKD